MIFFRKTVFLSVAFLLIFELFIFVWDWNTVNTQPKPLTYPEIITALKTQLPNGVFNNKTQLITWLITQIKQRKVDKLLNESREEDLRQAGATDELIEVIRQHSPPAPTPTPVAAITTPVPTPIATPAQSGRSAKDGEMVFWEEIKNSKDIRNFEEYLRLTETSEFKGTFKAAAELKIFRLKKEKSEAYWLTIKPLAKLLLQYDDINSLKEGFAGVRIGDIYNGKYGFINEKGEVAVPLIYDGGVGYFYDGYAVVAKKVNGSYKYGFIDNKAIEKTTFIYNEVWYSGDGISAVGIGTYPNIKYGYITPLGIEIIPSNFDLTFGFSEDLARVETKGKWGFIDVNGQFVIPAKYDFAWNFNDGLAYVCLGEYPDRNCGFIDKTGKEVIPLIYNNASSFSEGLASVRVGKGVEGKDGFIDKSGQMIISPKYDYANNFSEGLAMVSMGQAPNRKYGFIDKSGKEIVSIKYEDALSFRGGLAYVKFNGKYGFVDKLGREIIPLKYEGIWCNFFKTSGIIGVKLNGKKVFVDIYSNEYFDF